jgi:hypothetical protein
MKIYEPIATPDGSLLFTEAFQPSLCRIPQKSFITYSISMGGCFLSNSPLSAVIILGMACNFKRASPYWVAPVRAMIFPWPREYQRFSRAIISLPIENERELQRWTRTWTKIIRIREEWVEDIVRKFGCRRGSGWHSWLPADENKHWFCEVLGDCTPGQPR